VQRRHGHGHRDPARARARRALQGLTEPESDRDTMLAIVGGVVGAVAPPPPAWVAAREPLTGPLFEA